jgi:hypothetical protein
VPAIALLSAFVVHLRIQARQRMQRPNRATARPSFEGSRATDEPQTELAASGFVPGPSRAVVVETKGSRSASSQTETVTAEASTASAGESSDDAEWRPNPLPLPTYVTAPKAVRPIKVIDLTTPGAWSSGRLIEDDLADEDLLAAEVADAELDALLEQEAAPPVADDSDAGRRAVGD